MLLEGSKNHRARTGATDAGSKGAGRSKRPQTERALHHCGRLHVTAARTVCRPVTRLPSSLDVLTKVTKRNSFPWQSFAKNDRQETKQGNLRRGRNSTKTLNSVEDRVILHQSQLYYRSIFILFIFYFHFWPHQVVWPLSSPSRD